MSDWIKYGLGKPKQGQIVLAFAGRQLVAEYWEHEPGTHDSDTGFCDENGDEIGVVTHFMELPENPK